MKNYNVVNQILNESAAMGKLASYDGTGRLIDLTLNFADFIKYTIGTSNWPKLKKEIKSVSPTMEFYMIRYDMSMGRVEFWPKDDNNKFVALLELDKNKKWIFSTWSGTTSLDRLRKPGWGRKDLAMLGPVPNGRKT